MANSITVAIRIRPLSKLEVAEGQVSALSVDGQKIVVTDPTKAPASPMRFRFDEVLCSAPNCSTALATQSTTFISLGLPLLRNLIDGYNACLLCYGQTGSGKTYTMMGTPAEPGLVPRCAETIFQCLEERNMAECQSASLVQVSFIEIYNEKVHDLLAPEQCGSPKMATRCSDQKVRGSLSKVSRSCASVVGTVKGLRVRQHPLRGAFVEGLTHHTVASGDAILELVRRGNDARATAATRMNERSSRSHAIVTIEVAQHALISQPGEEEVFSSKTSRVHLVDLAGSERVTKSNVEGARLQELTAINLSLSTLSRVIETLSDTSRSSSKLPPYRESTLTWLLADSFGGNSKTTMIANVSPAASSLSETTSTLRYAARARRIVNQAVINEDPSAALISALQAETQQLRLQLQEMSEHAMNFGSVREVGNLRSKLNFSEQLIDELKEHEEQERRNFELQIQRLSAHHEEQALTHQEMCRKLDGTESQLQWAQQEAKRKDAEVEFLREKSVLLEEQQTVAAERIQTRERQIKGFEDTVRQLQSRLEESEAELTQSRWLQAEAEEQRREAEAHRQEACCLMTSLNSQMAECQAEAEQMVQVEKTRAQALEQTICQLQAQAAEAARCSAVLQANLESAACQAEATQRQCAEAQGQVQETRQRLEARMVAERAVLQELRGLSLGDTVSGTVPTVQQLEEAEQRLVAGWQHMIDDLQQCQDRLARQEQEQQQQVQELKESCQQQRQALEEATCNLQEGIVKATAREAALQGRLEEKARQVQTTQQECREAQQREWGAQQQLTQRMTAEWKVLQQLRLPSTMEDTALAVSPGANSVEQLEAAEAQLVGVWQRMQSDLTQFQQRLAKKEAEAAQVLQASHQEKLVEAQRSRPDVARLTLEHSLLLAQVTDLQLQLEEAAEHCSIADQQRREWEENAKGMARQMQERMVAEGRLLMALQCAGSGLAKGTTSAGSEVDRALEVVSALGAERASLQKRLQDAEEELAQCRWWSAGTCVQEGNAHPPSSEELVTGLREAMAELELRMAAVAGQGKAVAAMLESTQGAEDVLAMCEHIMCRARDVLTVVSDQCLPAPGPNATAAAGPTLEQVLQQLQEEDRAQWASAPQEKVDPIAVQQVTQLQPDRLTELAQSGPEGTSHLLQAMMEEYTRMLQDTVENRREWRALYDGLSLTMQAVSGRPRFLLFQFGPTSAVALEEALRRQEELNARAAAWLMGLYTQRDVLKQNVLAQLRVNGRIAQERSALQAELKDVSGKLQRAMAVVRRLHTEQDALLQTPRSPFPAPLEATTTMQSLSCQ
eukprot:GGOE01011189.1.p1 GENE.GGOE01011189.1~~GGOE01011189.1.p1  ORF type:complete len:1517 (-),score=515.13 GGOE01011189.1:2071-5979(-)